MVKNMGVILAGGVGTRFNGDIPKQYMKLNGKEIIAYSIDAFKSSKLLDELICVVNEAEYQEKNIQTKYNVICIKGGKSRNESLYNAIIFINKYYPNCEKVLIHEAARPFIKSEIIDKYLMLLDDYDAVVTASKITDSLGTINGQHVDRNNYCLIQAPEAFWIRDLLEHFSPNSDITGTVHQLPYQSNVYYNFDFKYNLKITYPEDLFVAEQLIKLKYYRRHIEDRDKVDKLVNKKALIFGATGGIGSEIVKMFQKMGVKMLAPSSKQLDLEIVSVKDVLNYCKDFKPDIIINAAAYSATDDDGLVNMFDKVFKINLKSNLILIEFAKLLNKRANLVLFSSSSSTKGRENLTLYSAAKVGVNSIVESLAEKMSKHGVYINAIVPEKINTPMIQKLHKGKVIYKELLSVEDILDAVIYYSSADTFGELAHIRRGL